MTAFLLENRATKTSHKNVTVVLSPFLVIVLLLLAAIIPFGASAFSVVPVRVAPSSSRQFPLQRTPTRAATSVTTTALWMGGRKINRGKLASNIDVDTATTASKRRTEPKKNNASSKQKRSQPDNKKSSGGSSSISPALSEWMAKQTADDDDDDDGKDATLLDVAVEAELVSEKEEEDADDTVSTFTSFQDTTTNKSLSSSSTRRRKQSARTVLDIATDKKIQKLVSEIQTILKQETKTRDLASALCGPLQSLLDLCNSNNNSNDNLRQLTSSSSVDYRLAWVGSDDALCQFGTAMHKVPLARLEEVFLSFPARPRQSVQVQEVIRILGPFPNVKNVLQGTWKTTTRNDNDDTTLVDWKITWTSMVDGTGKELLAGNDTRVVELQLCCCHPSILVATVVVPQPAKNAKSKNLQDINNNNDNPLLGNAKNVLLFLQETELQDKLDKLRVT